MKKLYYFLRPYKILTSLDIQLRTSFSIISMIRFKLKTASFNNHYDLFCKIMFQCQLQSKINSNLGNHEYFLFCAYIDVTLKTSTTLSCSTRKGQSFMNFNWLNIQGDFICNAATSGYIAVIRFFENLRMTFLKLCVIKSFGRQERAKP